MSIKERIQSDMKEAMRAKDAPRLSTIRMLLAAIKQREVDERIELGDTQIVGIVDKLIKQRRDSIAAFDQGQRQDLADKERAEVLVLEAYLPTRLSDQEIEESIKAIVHRLGAKGPGDMGRVMAVAKAELAGTADMSTVSAAVKKALAT